MRFESLVLFTATYDNGRSIRFVWQLRESKGKKENIDCFVNVFLYLFR